MSILNEVIDPKFFKRDKNILELFLSKIMNEVKKGDSLLKSDEFQRHFQKIVKLLSKDFKSTEEYYQHLEYNNGIIDLEELHNISNEIIKLVKYYLNEKDAQFSHLLILVDDIDMVDIELVYDMIKQIELYFMRPNSNIFVVLAYDEAQFIDSIHNYNLIQNKVLLENNEIDHNRIKNLSHRVYEKIIPMNNRVILPSISDIYDMLIYGFFNKAPEELKETYVNYFETNVHASEEEKERYKKYENFGNGYSIKISDFIFERLEEVVYIKLSKFYSSINLKDIFATNLRGLNQFIIELMKLKPIEKGINNIDGNGINYDRNSELHLNNIKSMYDILDKLIFNNFTNYNYHSKLSSIRYINRIKLNSEVCDMIIEFFGDESHPEIMEFSKKKELYPPNTSISDIFYLTDLLHNNIEERKFSNFLKLLYTLILMEEYVQSYIKQNDNKEHEFYEYVGNKSIYQSIFGMSYLPSDETKYGKHSYSLEATELGNIISIPRIHIKHLVKYINSRPKQVSDMLNDIFKNKFGIKLTEFDISEVKIKELTPKLKKMVLEMDELFKKSLNKRRQTYNGVFGDIIILNNIDMQNTLSKEMSVYFDLKLLYALFFDFSEFDLFKWIINDIAPKGEIGLKRRMGKIEHYRNNIDFCNDDMYIKLTDEGISGEHKIKNIQTYNNSTSDISCEFFGIDYFSFLTKSKYLKSVSKNYYENDLTLNNMFKYDEFKSKYVARKSEFRPINFYLRRINKYFFNDKNNFIRDEILENSERFYSSCAQISKTFYRKIFSDNCLTLNDLISVGVSSNSGNVENSNKPNSGGNHKNMKDMSNSGNNNGNNNFAVMYFGKRIDSPVDFERLINLLLSHNVNTKEAARMILMLYGISNDEANQYISNFGSSPYNEGLNEVIQSALINTEISKKILDSINIKLGKKSYIDAFTKVLGL